MSADAEILKEFLVESYENLDQLDRDFVALEKDPTERDRIAAIFRTIHTIKGTAGFLGFPRLGALTHAGESLLSLLRDGTVTLTPAITSALLAMVDAVREMLQRVESTSEEGEESYPAIIEVLSNHCQSAARSVAAPPLAAPTAAAPRQAVSPAPVAAPPPVQAALAPSPSAHIEPAKPNAAMAVDAPEHSKAIAPASADGAQAHPDASGGVADTTVRVDVGLLDKLMNLVGELVLARNQIVQFASIRRDATLLSASQRLNLVTTELQEGVMRTRMQPIASVWNKLPRVVRDLSLSCGKQIDLELEGKETELDRTVIEAIKDPLTHIVRNSVDHGIESPDERLAKGKPVVGRLHLRAFHEGGQVNIEISDDGAGVDPEKVRKKAIQRGIVSSERAFQMTDREITRLIFMPGFSTAERVTAVSGRGVGMDVVKTNIERTGGTVDLVSRPGAGTTIKIKIPLTLAIIPALIVSLGADRYAIPQVSLLELVRIEAAEVKNRVERIQGAPVLRLRDKLLPLVDLRTVLAEPALEQRDDVNVVILQADDRAFGLVVDGVNDTEEIVVKPLGRELKGLTTFAGATILGDGRVALIVDVAGVARRAEVLSEVRERTSLASKGTGAEAKDDTGQALLLLQRGGHGRVALPLAHVARLEEFPRESIELVGSRRVMQYRGEILPLVSLDGVLGPSGEEDGDAQGPSDKVQVVVLSDASGSIGLEIDRILDIVYDRVVVKKAGERPGVRGTAVIQGRVTEMLDVAAAMRAVSALS